MAERRTTTMNLRSIRFRNAMEMSGITGGRDITRPWIGPLLEPLDPILRTRGGGSFDIYKPILTDPQVKSVWQQRVAAVVSRPWEVEPGEDSRRGRAAADWLRGEIDGLDWDEITRQMLSGVFYGYAVAEQIFRRDGALWGWEAIRVRDRVRFRFDEDLGLRLLTMSDMLTGEEMPADKFWCLSTGADHSDEPYGLGLAHWLYWPVWFKRNGLRLWLIALDKFGMPTAMGKYPNGASEEEKAKLLDAVLAIRSEAGIVVPEGMDISLLTPSGGAQGLDYRALHDTMDAAISKVILSQTMTTDSGSSLSQARVHEGVAEHVARADADLICASFNRGPVARLSELNFPGVAPPRVWRVMDDPEDTDAAIARDEKLHNMGWQMTEARLKDIYGDGYERAQTPPQAGDTPAAGAAPAVPAFAEHAHESSLDDLVRNLIDAGHAETAVQPLLADIEAVLAGLSEITTLEDLRVRLDALAAEGGDAARLADLLGRATLITRLAGEFGAPVEDQETAPGVGRLPGARRP